MKLRKLHLGDAPGMFEWMKDPECNKHFRFDPDAVTMESVGVFIEKANQSTDSRHYAVADARDEYLGTISLKNIDENDKSAEYAISLRRGATGRGIGYKATVEILSIAFGELGLNRVYLNVLPDNSRAIALYKKCGFRQEGVFRQHFFARGKYLDIIWFGILKEDYLDVKRALSQGINGMKLGRSYPITFKQLGDRSGNLVVIEEMTDIPFEIKRVFYIYGSSQGVVRGRHANRESEFVLINVCGTSKVLVDDGVNREVYDLDRPHIGVYLPRGVWKEMYDFSADSILLCLASTKYDSNEYIRDYDDFLSEIAGGEAKK